MKKLILLLGMCMVLLMPFVMGYTEGQPYPDLNASSPSEIMNYSTNVTDGWMPLLMLMATSLVAIIIFRKQGNRLSDSLALGFVINLMTIGVFLWGLGLLDSKYLTLWIVFTILSTIYSLADSN